MRGQQSIIAAVLLATASAAAAADETPICADRPGKATSACTVPAGHWQVETALADWALQKSEGERDTSLVISETTLKYGLNDRSDIEVDVTPWRQATSSGPGFHDSANGIGDVKVIYKYQLTPASTPVQATLYPYVKIPTATHALGNGKWEGGLLMPIGYAIPKSPLSLNLTPEVDWVADADGNGHHAAMVQVASLGWQASTKLNLSAEIWGRWDWDPSGTVKQASADGSVAYLLSNDVQLDTGANLGLNDQTPGIEVYAGVSVRF